MLPTVHYRHATGSYKTTLIKIGAAKLQSTLLPVSVYAPPSQNNISPR
ncbi:hypothetical protein [Lonsdalea quercina]|nr:hypothetical protein [Lonsdalea quercina]